MSCINPILAVSVGKNKDGKNMLKFIPRSEIEDLEFKRLVYGSDEVFLLPCSKCPSCRDDYARDWSIRCTLEAQEHRFNYFLTLTYDNFHIKRACKKDFTKFLKNLGYFLTGKSNRPLFFACMERGEHTNRLHFHCILFLDHELSLINPVKIGDYYHYTCDDLTRIWSNGFVDVAEFECDCARYVAKYATKDGKCFMSRNLAKSYYLKHKEEIIDDDFKVYGKFSNFEYVNIPTCFVRWFIEDGFDLSSYKMTNKKIRRLLDYAELHARGKSSEADLIRDRIFNVLDNLTFKKVRKEL